MDKGASIKTLKGIGDKTQKLFEKIGVRTIEDLLHYYPSRYEVYEEPIPISEIQEGQVATVTGAIFGRVQVGGHKNLQITSIHLKDMTGTLTVIWFRMPFLKNTLARGGVITLRGRIVQRKGMLVMEHPEVFYPAAKYEQKKDTLQPVYRLTAGLSNNLVQKAVVGALVCLANMSDYLPADIRSEYRLDSYCDAVENLHFPKDKEEFYEARRRLVFDEFLLFALSLQVSKKQRKRKENLFSFPEQTQVTKFLEKLPYQLTGAQKRVWKEIYRDLSGPYVMARLIQGDVGAGKTVVALLGLIYVASNSCQGALMAPTEVLAKQHYDNISRMLKVQNLSIRVELLMGSMSAKEKKEAHQRIGSGEVDIIIGTHALIQEKVEYKKLALVVIDEQHRFGVKQREAFAEKGEGVHVLVMSATPIPRTLAVILYGDLEVSVLDELPKNRLPIRNCVVGTEYRKSAYTFMKKQVTGGRQCFVICPMIEESDNLELENVLGYSQTLQEHLGEEIEVAFLHGKMKQEQKDEIMARFSANQIHVLVSTTVIEVGIDVANATVMLIENAERFGLAQLHQLRGRVGRGEHASYCIFMSATKSKDTRERLEILNTSNDGFFIAAEDLRLRGPGDIFGIRQSGLMDFQLGDVFQDAKLLKQANDVAKRVLEADEKLEMQTHERLKRRLDEYLGRQLESMTL